MDQFILIITLIVLITVLIRLVLYLKFRFDLKDGRIKIFKLKGYRRFAWYNVFSVWALIFLGVFLYKTHDSFDFLIAWSSLILSKLIDIFIIPENYLLTDYNGIKRSYIGRKYPWKYLTIKQNCEKLSIQKGKKTMVFEFKEIAEIETFRELALDSKFEIIECKSTVPNSGCYVMHKP